MSTPPIMRSIQLVLSNGASITIPSTIRRSKPYFSNFDVHNHNLWRHNIQVESGEDDAQQGSADYTRGFYARYKASRRRPAAEGKSQDK